MKEDSESVHIKYVCVSLAVRWTQTVTTRADVHSGRTSHRTSLWWGCRSGIRTSRTSQGRHRRGPPGWREDPRTLAGTHRSAAASGTYPSVRSWRPKSTKAPLVKKSWRWLKTLKLHSAHLMYGRKAKERKNPDTKPQMWAKLSIQGSKPKENKKVEMASSLAKALHGRSRIGQLWKSSTNRQARMPNWLPAGPTWDQTEFLMRC